MAQKITDIVQRQKIVEKSIILFKVLYHYLNMMPIKIQFELSLKLFACIFFSIRSEATKNYKKLAKTLRFLQIFPKT